MSLTTLTILLNPTSKNDLFVICPKSMTIIRLWKEKAAISSFYLFLDNVCQLLINQDYQHCFLGEITNYIYFNLLQVLHEKSKFLWSIVLKNHLYSFENLYIFSISHIILLRKFKSHEASSVQRNFELVLWPNNSPKNK